MTRNILTEALKGYGIKRATVREEIGGHYLDVICSPVPSMIEQDDFRERVRPAGFMVSFYKMKWNENWFKRFQYVEVEGPHLPRHQNCRCVLHPMEGSEE